MRQAAFKARLQETERREGRKDGRKEREKEAKKEGRKEAHDILPYLPNVYMGKCVYVEMCRCLETASWTLLHSSDKSVCLSVCLSVCPSVCKSVNLVIYVYL